MIPIRDNTSKVIDFKKITAVAVGAIILESNLPSDCPFTPDVTQCVVVNHYLSMLLYISPDANLNWI
jgi:hypothetical protein